MWIFLQAPKALLTCEIYTFDAINLILVGAKCKQASDGGIFFMLSVVVGFFMWNQEIAITREKKKLLIPKQPIKYNKGQHETNKTPHYQDWNDHILIHESVKSNEIKNVKEAREKKMKSNRRIRIPERNVDVCFWEARKPNQQTDWSAWSLWIFLGVLYREWKHSNNKKNEKRLDDIRTHKDIDFLLNRM